MGHHHLVQVIEMKYKYHSPDGEVIIHRVSFEGNYKTPLMSISELSKVLHIDRETLTKRIKKHRLYIVVTGVETACLHFMKWLELHG